MSERPEGHLTLFDKFVAALRELPAASLAHAAMAVLAGVLQRSGLAEQGGGHKFIKLGSKDNLPEIELRQPQSDEEFLASLRAWQKAQERLRDRGWIERPGSERMVLPILEEGLADSCYTIVQDKLGKDTPEEAEKWFKYIIDVSLEDVIARDAKRTLEFVEEIPDIYLDGLLIEEQPKRYENARRFLVSELSELRTGVMAEPKYVLTRELEEVLSRLHSTVTEEELAQLAENSAGGLEHVRKVQVDAKKLVEIGLQDDRLPREAVDDLNENIGKSRALYHWEEERWSYGTADDPVDLWYQLFGDRHASGRAKECEYDQCRRIYVAQHLGGKPRKYCSKNCHDSDYRRKEAERDPSAHARRMRAYRKRKKSSGR